MTDAQKRVPVNADDALLDAAMEQFSVRGIARTTTDDIARAAGVNRSTLFRRLGNKEQIVTAAMLREYSRIITGIQAAVDGLDGFEARMTDGFAQGVLLLREHPLVRRALTVDRDDLLATFTVEAGAMLEFASAANLEILRRAQADYGVPAQAGDEVAAALVVRMVHSFVLMPDAPPRLQTAEELRAFAAVHVLPLYLPRTPDPEVS